MIGKKEFLKKSNRVLGEIYDTLNNLQTLDIKGLDKRNTALIIVDMVNGFAREGALNSPRVESIIPAVAELSEACDKLGISKIAFADSHTEASPEFQSYPAHCIKGTFEEEIVDEIKSIGGYKLIHKNSTNGFLEEEFQLWLKNNRNVDTFIITGDCTDICVQQFSITLKTWFNMQNRKSRIVVPINAVETYDLGVHYGELMNVTAFYNMIINGVEVVKQIDIK